MSGFSPRALRSFEIARQVFDLLAANNVESAVIGSVALAVHGYVRATRDLDLGVAILSVRDLRRGADALRASGCEVDVIEPAPDDDLGGVVTVAGPDFDPIQIVNLRAPDGRHAKLAKDAVSSAKRMPGIALPVPSVDRDFRLDARFRLERQTVSRSCPNSRGIPVDSGCLKWTTRCAARCRHHCKPLN